MRIPAWLLVALLGTTGCRVFDESLLTASSDAEPSDAGVGRDAPVTVDAPVSVDAGPGCELRRPPSRPAGTDDGADVGEVIFLLHHLTFDQSEDRWRTLGWDLDGICSLPPEPRVECVARAASAVAEIDGEGGVDNSVGHNLLDLLLLAFPELTSSLDANHRGLGAIMLRVRGWNGLDEDPRVDVAFAQTVVATPPLPDGGMPDVRSEDLAAGDFPPEPNWDGSDWFWARRSSFVDGDAERPRIRVDNAYVSGRMLVVPLPDRVPISFSGADISLTVYVSDAKVAGRISDDRASLEAPMLGARWPVADLLTALPYAGVCPGSDAYRAIERVTDLTADIRAVPGTGGDGVTCDALSMGLGATGTRSHFGGLVDSHDALPNACALVDGGVPDGG